MVKLSLFILMKITPPCLVGSKTWNKLFGSVAFGRKVLYWHNTKVLNVFREKPTVVAIAFYLLNPTLLPRNPNSKNLLYHGVISVTSTQSIIASSILLSNIGGQQNSIIETPPKVKTNNIVEMEKKMLACLDDIPLLQIQRYSSILNLFKP
jgi:hypothetical protein